MLLSCADSLSGSHQLRPPNPFFLSPFVVPFYCVVQSRGRVDQLRRLGHSVDKVEFILMGGTFMSLPADYRDYFIRNLHDSLSGHTSRDVDEAVRQGNQRWRWPHLCHRCWTVWQSERRGCQPGRDSKMGQKSQQGGSWLSAPARRLGTVVSP